MTDPTPLGWALGCMALGIELVAVGAVAVAARRRLVPEATGAEARLAEAIVGVATALVVGGALGSVGLLRPLPVLVAFVVLGGAVWAAELRAGRATVGGSELDGDQRPVASGGPTWLVLAAAATTVVVALAWITQAAASYRRGVYDGDSLWYHQPFAARFVQTGWVTRIHFVNGEPLVSFFPANSELLHALTVLPVGNDGLAPLVNLAWLAVALLTGWVAGARRGQGAAGLLVAAGLCALPVVLLTQAGTARNDLMGYVLLASGLVFGLDGRPERGRAVLVALALGMAVGVKVSLLAPVALVLLALVAAWWLEGRRRALPALATLVVTFVAAGAPWYVRNWVRIGNPLPWAAVHLGPLHFEKPPLPQAAVGDSSLLRRLDETGWWGQLVHPGLGYAFGRLWWMVLAAAVVAVALAVVRSATDRRIGRARWVAGAAVAAAAAYVVTPNSAALPVGEVLAPTIFSLNTRYLLPALLIALLAAVGSLGVRSTQAISLAVAGAGLVSLAPGELHDGFEWHSSARDLGAAVGAAVALVVLGGAVVLVRRQGGIAMARGAAAVAVAVAVAATGVVVSHHLDGRWQVQPPPFAAAATWPFAAELTDARIGVVGDFFQYPYTGRSGSNHVQYLGVPGPHGAFRDARTCEEWRRAVAAADVDYVVVTQQIFGDRPDAGPVEWTASDPAARLVRTDGGGQVYRLDRKGGNDDGCR